MADPSIAIRSEASDAQDVEQTVEAQLLWRQKLETQQLEQVVLTLKAQQQYYDNFAALFAEGLEVIKELRIPLVEFLSSAKEAARQEIVKSMEKTIDGRILKVLANAGLIDPRSLDEFNRRQGRQVGQPQPELDVGGQVMADLGDMNIG